MKEEDIQIDRIHYGSGDSAGYRLTYLPTGQYVQGRTDEPDLIERLRRELSDTVRPGVITLNPAWLTSTVKALAEQIYNGSAFDLIPILGDALEESGCHDHQLLKHCRSGGEHVRECWAFDLLLGKSWVKCEEPNRMLELMRTRATERKLRLLSCASCRRIGDDLFSASLGKTIVRDCEN